MVDFCGGIKKLVYPTLKQLEYQPVKHHWWEITELCYKMKTNPKKSMKYNWMRPLQYAK